MSDSYISSYKVYVPIKDEGFTQKSSAIEQEKHSPNHCNAFLVSVGPMIINRAQTLKKK